MPINNELENMPMLVNLKTGKRAKPKFINNLENVNVKLLNYPTYNDLLSYIPEFTSGTWADKPKTDFTLEERKKVIDDLMKGHLLPTAMETIGLTFIVEGIDLIDVCHLLRHRTMSFSASGTADRDMRFDNVLVKPSIQKSKYYEKYKKIIEDSMKLYAEMIDDENIPILDPRTILPRCTSNYYYFRVNLKDAMGFIHQRKDEQIEPESINIFALKMWLEILKVYPSLKGKVDIDGPDHFYKSTAPSGRSSNFYPPSEKNDTFEWKKSWFMKNKKREEMIAGDQYISIRDQLLKEIANI